MVAPTQTSQLKVTIRYAAPAVISIAREGGMIAARPVTLSAEITFRDVPVGPIDVTVESEGLQLQKLANAHVTPSPHYATAVAILGPIGPVSSGPDLLERIRSAAEELGKLAQTVSSATVADQLARIEQKLEALEAAVREVRS